MDENRNIPLHSPQPVALQPSLIGSLVATSPSITGSSPVLIEGSPIASHSEGARRGSAVSSRASNLLELNAPEQPSLAAFAAPSSFSRYHDRQHSRSPSKSPKAIYSPSNIIQGCKIPRSPSPSSRGRSSSRREQAASRASSAVKSFLSPSPNRYRSPVTIHRRRTPSHSRERRRDWPSRTIVCSRRSRSRYERRSPSPSRDRCGNRTWISRSPSPYTRDRYRSRIEIHSRYRFVDANVSIIVEDRIRFDVHRHFLERDSVFLQGMLSARPNGQDGSYNLAGLTIQEFESLLDFFYDGMYRMSPTDTSIQSWVDLLAASTKLHFAKARQHAIAAIEICRSSSGDHLTPARMIYLATTYGVMEWLEPAYAALIEREELMSDEEAEMIGAKRVLLVAKAREARLKERPLRHADWEPRNQAGPSASSALYGPCLGSQPFPHPPAPISCVQTPITEDDWDCTGTTVSPPLTGRLSCCDISPASITLPPSPGGSPYPFRSSASLRSSLTPSSPSSPSSLPSNEIRSRTPNDHPSSTRYSPTRHDRPPQVDRLVTPLPGVTIALSTLIPGSPCADAYPGPPPPEIHIARSSVSPVSTATSYSGTFRCSWGHPSQPSPRLGGDTSGKTLYRGDLLKEKDGSRLLPVNNAMRPKSLTETVVDTIFDS